MEGSPVIKTFLGQINKVFHMPWRRIREKFQRYVPKLCFDDCFCCRHLFDLLFRILCASGDTHKNAQNDGEKDLGCSHAAHSFSRHFNRIQTNLNNVMFYQKPSEMSNKTRGLHLEYAHETGNMPFYPASFS